MMFVNKSKPLVSHWKSNHVSTARKVRSRLKMGGSILLFAACGCSNSAPEVSQASVKGAAAWQTTTELVRVSTSADAATLRQQRENDPSSVVQQYPNGTIGTQACAECHPQQYKSYFETAHARSARRIADSTLQAESKWTHPISKRVYEVVGTGQSMMHHETIPGEFSPVRSRQAAEIAYEFGSGSNAHTYLFRDGAFMCESPLTWYAKTAAWDLSPGYNPTGPTSFSRTITTGCVYCHVGSIDVIDKNSNQFRVHEHAIGCERCHGPGDAHAKIYSQTEVDASLVDRIVQPAKLDRDESEAICSQCHLQGEVFVSATGKDIWDYRPGDLLSSNRTDFKTASQADEFRIVGHTEQLHASQCYQQSTTLTCISCHDPHRHNQAAASVDAYREVCAKCHSDAACGIGLATRQKANANDCSKCHMPKRDTNVTHAALHHHTIGIHGESFAALDEMPSAKTRLVTDNDGATSDSEVYPISPDPSLSQQERDRRWALAVHHFVFNGRKDELIRQEMPRAKRVLLELHRSGLVDADVMGALAKDYLDAGMIEPAKQLATSLVQSEPLFTDAKTNAVDVLAQIAFRQQDNATAMQWYQQLTQSRRVSGDHYLLGICQTNAGQVDDAIDSLQHALRIDPSLIVAHEQLAALLDHQGNSDQAAAHRMAIRELRAATP